MVECQLPKLKAAGSNPVSRSKESKKALLLCKAFLILMLLIVIVQVLADMLIQVN